MSALTIPSFSFAPNMQDVRAMVGLLLKSRSASQVRTLGALDEIGAMLVQIVASVLEKRSASDFSQAALEALPKYARLLLAASALLRDAASETEIDRMAAQGLSAIEADVRARALDAFGPEVRNQAIFTIWTLRKVGDLCQQIVSAGDCHPSERSRDAEFASRFAGHVLWARFNLDCLLVYMYSEGSHPIYPGVLDEVVNGLRAAVNAYAWARQGLALRSPQSETLFETTLVEWDDEDRQLLDAATSDIGLDAAATQ